MLDKSYEPKAIEAQVAKIWQSKPIFQAKTNEKKESFCICIPPPNVTGDLHMGHGFELTIIDIVVRYMRMQGIETHWQMGTDHAGISTQMVVERQLEQQGKYRKDMDRDTFIDAIWQWIEQRNIREQIKRMGASVDWEKERFTLDESLSASVRSAFVQLYQSGTIYRGRKLVHWETQQQTAVSDLEVENKDIHGHLYHFRYPLKKPTSSISHITIATTRPETMLGDTAVAVHPDDERYQDLIGQTIVLPLVGREIPIIADDYVDPKFGSGCVKITPAHDFNDYEVGIRHQLEQINILHPNGTINENAPSDYQGLSIQSARKKVVSDLESLSLVETIEPHKHTVPVCDRTQVVLEPYLTQQWFMKMDDLAQEAIQVVKDGQIQFQPKHEEKVYFHWLENIQDWCISRQLWWGHRIPAWYDDHGKCYVGDNEVDVRQAHQLGDDVKLTQDEDVLDTWFSSALWPFATLGWPEKTPMFERFFPNALMITGFDILFFWVARMIMMSLALTKQVPFKHVYLHGLVRDEAGQKMSKSKGNVLDPLDLIDGIGLDALVDKRTRNLMQPQMKKRIETNTRKHFPDGIEAHGTDALRMTFCALATTGRDIPFNMQRLNGYRNFCNKIWNATRFCQPYLSTSDATIDANKIGEYHAIHHWILTKLNQCIDDYHQHLADYRFDRLAQTVFEFCWNVFCDWYIELSKINFQREPSDPLYQHNQIVLTYVLKQTLLLLHPIIPYITEALWKEMGDSDTPCAISNFPQPLKLQGNSKEHYDDIEWLKTLITSIRTIRSEMNISPKTSIELVVEKVDERSKERLEKYDLSLKSIAKIDHITLLEAPSSPPASASHWDGQVGYHIPLSGLIDTKEELQRIDRSLKNIGMTIEKSQSMLNNQRYLDGAPKAVVDKQKDQLSQQLDLQNKLRLQRSIIEQI